MIPKIVVSQIVKAIRPAPFQKQIQEDLEFTHNYIRKDWLVSLSMLLAGRSTLMNVTIIGPHLWAHLNS
jgi:hypothetical protein